jgi:hypothetical protein
MKIDGDIIPFTSGTSHLGVDGSAGDAFSVASISPFGHIHQNSGVFHNPHGSSGVIRYGRSAIGMEVSNDGGKSYLAFATIPSTANDNDVFFCKNGVLSTNSLGLTFNQDINVLGTSGILGIKQRSLDPLVQQPISVRPSGVTHFAAINLSERPMLGAMNQRTVSPVLFQQALFNRLTIMCLTSRGTTIGTYGGTSSTTGTVSHTEATIASGIMLNFMTAKSASNQVAGVGSNDFVFVRGGMSGINTGFFFACRIVAPDLDTSESNQMVVFAGMSSGALAAPVLSDDPAGDHCGFQFSALRGDLTWQVMTKDNTTQGLQDTGMSIGPNRIFDMYLYCPPFPDNGTIYWTIQDKSWNILKSGTVITNLPRTNQFMRFTVCIGSGITNLSKNIRVTHIYGETL